MRVVPTSVTLLLLVGLAFMPAAQAHSGKAIEVSAQDTGCASGKSLCFDFAAQPDEIFAGEIVDLILYNDASSEHVAMVTAAENADDSHRDTDKADALAATPRVAPEEASQEQTFTVPDTDTLYIWCDITGHEGQGMWIEVPVSSASSGGNGEQTNGSPMGSAASVFALALAGIAGLVRRSW